MRSVCLLCLVLLAGCRIETARDEAPAPDLDAEARPAEDRADGLTDADAEALEAGARGTDVVTAESPDDAAPTTAAPSYTLRRIVLGDRACYIDLQAVDTEIEKRLADFGVCSQTEVEDLIGKRVQIEVGQARVMAASCEGDPECEDVESVELVTRLFAAE